jgi:drug/metabolite transporter (DMT)-like permease
LPGIEKLQRIEGRTVAYVAFGAFCALSATRDVISEFLFKNGTYGASPIFVLFVYSIVTQCVAGIVLLPHLYRRPQNIIGPTGEVLWLNGFTLAAFLFYFLAINSPVGAAANSFIDYGSSPVFTAILAALLAHERLDLTFAISAFISVCGIVALSVPRVTVEEYSLLWAAGLAFSLLSSLSSGFYRVYFRLLLARGMMKSAVIFFRLFGLTIVLGGVLLIKPELFRSDLLLETSILGLVGFTVPLFLSLTIIQRLTLRSFAMLLFALPAITFFLSAGLGYTRLFPTDIVAGALAIVGVVVYEKRTSNNRR